MKVWILTIDDGDLDPGIFLYGSEDLALHHAGLFLKDIIACMDVESSPRVGNISALLDVGAVRDAMTEYDELRIEELNNGGIEDYDMPVVQVTEEHIRFDPITHLEEEPL